MYTEEELKKLIEKMGKLAKTLDTINDIEEFEIGEMMNERKEKNIPIEPLFSMTDEQLLEEIKAYDWAHRWDLFFG